MRAQYSPAQTQDQPPKVYLLQLIINFIDFFCLLFDERFAARQAWIYKLIFRKRFLTINKSTHRSAKNPPTSELRQFVNGS